VTSYGFASQPGPLDQAVVIANAQKLASLLTHVGDNQYATHLRR
jgi:hypothetical protein